MRIVFAGTPEFAVPSLHALATAGHDVVGAITREDAPVGRKRVLTPTPVALAAEKLGIPVFRANRLAAAATEWVRSLGVDLGVIVAYGGLVREPLLSLPELGWINLHFSELPRWRGAAPVQRALQAGERRLGVTVFRLVEALDAGSVLSRDARDVAAGVSAGRALGELAVEGTAALVEAVSRIADDPDAGEPQLGEPSYAHKLTRDDGRLDLSRPTEAVLNHWSGVTPEPGAFAMHEGQPIKLLHMRAWGNEFGSPHRLDSEAGRGSASVTLDSGVAALHLGDGELELVRVQPAGKPPMDGAAWLRGRGGSAVLS